MPITINNPGIFDSEAIPMPDYVSDPCPDPALSKGVVKDIITRSPLHAWQRHPRLGGSNRYSHRADIGSSAHSLLFGGASIHYLDVRYDDKHKTKAGQIVTDFKTNIAKVARDDALRRGQIPMLEKERGKFEAMMDIARPILEQFGPGQCEQTLIWQDHGVWCKSRPDWISADFRVCIDYKTATNAAPDEWKRRAMFPGGYEIQGALVLAGLRALRGEDNREFIDFVQEIDPPYACSLVPLSEELLDHTYEEKIRKAVDIWRKCLDEKHWPGYADTIAEMYINEAELPPYMVSQDERDTLEELGL